MENEIIITREQYDNLIKLSEVEVADNTQENPQDVRHRKRSILRRHQLERAYARHQERKDRLRRD